MSERRSQSDRIATALWSGERITALDALQRFGCLRLPSRIWDLRERGIPVKSRTISVGDHKHVSQYYISETDILLRDTN